MTNFQLYVLIFCGVEGDLQASSLFVSLPGENEMKVNPNLAITVIAASVVIGLGLVVIIILLFYYR